MNTCQCLNPDCLKYNPDNAQFCQHCGQGLLLVQRYRAIRILGQGGFGRTFLAVDELKPSKPSCVIKQFLPQAQGTSNVEKASELFAQEAEHLETLGKHDQIPELMAYFTQDERQYLVQEYIAGETLAQELEKNGVFTEEEIWQLLRDVLGILQFVHDNNVIHRDIKPENLIRRSKDNKIVLVDFGASKLTETQSVTVTGTVIGSAEYTSPEQSRGKPKYCSDLYSLGVTCLYLLTQVSPFDLYSVDEMDWVWRDFLNDNAVSDKLGKVLDKLVEGAVKRRYQTVEEVLNDISPVGAQGLRPSQGLRPNTQPLPPPPPPPITPQPVTPPSPKPATIIQPATPSLPKTITETLPNNVKLEMVLIPAGSFMMGSNECEEEQPIHEVTLNAFYMGKYPITQAQYQAVMRNNPSYFKTKSKGLFAREEDCWDHPVECVSWNDAQAFCQKLSQITGKTYQLPSEAQWEYACRAGSTTRYYFGDNESLLKDYAWCHANSNRQTHPVGQKKPNNWGLYDMHGNVWEWCEDDYVNNYNNAPTDGSAYGNGNYEYIVLRGGSWSDSPSLCRSANRDISSRDNYCSNYIGFRVMSAVGRTS
ncbi:MAG: SUMF1/EgtB/PvdO family nonheme iron enzyme [Microcystaceae cyanobacterium]